MRRLIWRARTRSPELPLSLLKKRRPPHSPAAAPGERVYAIGDLHGRLDLLDGMLAAIATDAAGRAPADTLVVLLGDLIDRGPDSAGVVARAMAGLGWARLVCLKGNHEAAMEGALDGDETMARIWLRNGGAAALASWGVAPSLIADGEPDAVLAAARATIPAATRAWLTALPLEHRSGDYLFVHAGIRPGVPLDEQEAEDRMWIRAPFLASEADHGAVIVHGHTIAREAQERRNRIGIDTGAYATGRLTALVVEGTERRFLRYDGAAGGG